MNTPSAEELFESHKELAYKIARSFPINSCTFEERVQDALLALWKSANAFDPSKGEFAPYASTSIRNQLRNTLTQVTRRTKAELVILDAPVLKFDESEGETLKETSLLSTDPAPNLEAERNDIRDVLNEAKTRLTPSQQAVLKDYINGASYADLSRLHGVTRPAIRQMVQRAVNQMRPEIESKGVRDVHYMPREVEEDMGLSHINKKIPYCPKPPKDYLVLLVFIIIAALIVVFCIFAVDGYLKHK